MLGIPEDDESSFAQDTYLWPTELPKNTGKPSTVKGNRIYQCGSQYYYAIDNFTVDWDEDVLLNPDLFSDHMLCLSQGLIYMEGDNLVGIVPGAIFHHHNQYWVYNGGEESKEPMDDDSDWIEITDLLEIEDDYDPGADTGPESDALYYPDAKFNPYPGTISSNCTFAVWAPANQALGVRLPNWGDAGNWFRRAGISGYPTGQNPAPYSIIVWDHHVGFVTAINEDGTMMYIKEGIAGRRYREGWWPIAPSRHGQKLYGFIYLTGDHGEAIQAETVIVSEGFNDTEEAFLKVLEELGLEPGNRQEEHSEDIEKGYIISYTTGELAKGSVVDYTVSLGPEEPEPLIVIDDDVVKELTGITKTELLAWFDKHGLVAGTETIEESDNEDGIILRVAKGNYKEGEAVNYITSRKKIEPEPADDQITEDVIEPTGSESEPSEGAETVPVETVIPTPSEETVIPAEPSSEPIQEQSVVVEDEPKQTSEVPADNPAEDTEDTQELPIGTPIPETVSEPPPTEQTEATEITQ